MVTTVQDPQALVADLEALSPSTLVGHRCQTGAALAALPDDIRPVVLAIIDRPDLSGPAICEVLARHGITLSSANVRRHRYRSTPSGCKCPRTSGDQA